MENIGINLFRENVMFIKLNKFNLLESFDLFAREQYIFTLNISF